MEKRFDVVCIGELNVDLILQRPSALPALGREIQCEDFALTLGSSTAICACVLGALRVKTAFMSRIAKDAFGKICLDTLRSYGVDGTYIAADAQKTGITVALSYMRDRALLTAKGDTIDSFGIDRVPESLLREVRHIHVGSFFMNTRLAAGLPQLFARAHKNGITTSLDAGWDDAEVFDSGLIRTLAHTDIFFPNEDEVCGIEKEKNVQAATRRLRNRMPENSLLAVKLGEKGCLILDGKREFAIPGYSVKVLDTTGAGDSFNAGFLAYWLEGKSLEECGRFAAAVGALSVTRSGGTSDCPRREEAEALMFGKDTQR